MNSGERQSSNNHQLLIMHLCLFNCVRNKGSLSKLRLNFFLGVTVVIVVVEMGKRSRVRKKINILLVTLKSADHFLDTDVHSKMPTQPKCELCEQVSCQHQHS